MKQRLGGAIGSPSAQPLLRNSEVALIGYFLYVAVVGLFLAIPPETARFTLLLNLAIVAGYFLLGHLDRKRPRRVISVVRDWLPIGFILLAYREMGWFAPEHHTYELERGWIVWDRLLLDDWHLRAAIEFLGPVLPAILELSYTLVYAIGPFSVAVLYLYSRHDMADQFLFTFVLGTVISYALYPYFPSEPPRAVFPEADMPRIDTVFRRFNWWILSGGGIHTSVFPSGHVSHAFAAAFAMMRVLPDKKWAGRSLFVLAVLIYFATVYGRYHYAVDGLAGLAVAVLAVVVTRAVERRSNVAKTGRAGQQTGC